MRLADDIAFSNRERGSFLKIIVCFFCSLLFPSFIFAQKPAYRSISETDPSSYKIFTSLNTFGNSSLNIFASNGEPLFYKDLATSCYDYNLQVGGTISYYNEDLSGFVILDSLLEEMDTIRALNGYETDFHELRKTKEGDYFIFGTKTRIVDMSQIIEGGIEDAQVKDMVVQKVDSDGNLLFEWKTEDHYNILDSYTNMLTHIIYYVHFNSLEMDTDSSIIVSSRNLRELTRINLKTGEVIWRMGGKNNQFEFRNFDRQFSGQHTISRKNDSVFTIFDNGWLLEPRYSKGVEFKINEDSMIVEQLRDYRHDPDIYANIVGSLQNMDNGNTLIYWGVNELHEMGGKFTEYDPEGTIVHEGEFINCTAPTYRVFKYKWENKIFVVNQDKVEFPYVSVGDSAIMSVTLSNNTRDVVTVNEILSDQSCFSIEEERIDIYQEGQYELELIFKPEQQADYSGYITLRAKDENSGVALQIEVSGFGLSNNAVDLESDSMPFRMYPVPFSDHFFYSSEKEIASLIISGIDGRQYWSEEQLSKSGKINTEDLPVTSFILSVFHKDGTRHTQKVIKTGSGF
ncbi:aryl-sulfate sulfotransferase [Bacteroidota bacterium]